MKNTERKDAQMNYTGNAHTETSEGLRSCRSRFYRIILLFTNMIKTFFTFVVRAITKKRKVEELKFYTTIHNISLYNFLKILCDGDFEYLYIEIPKKRNTVKEAEHFADLLVEYTEAMDGKSVQYEAIKKAANLMAKIRILEAALQVIATGRKKQAEGLKTVLKSLGINITDDTKRNVLIIQGKIDGFVREYKKIVEKENEKEDKKPTINSYIDILTAISTHFKFNLDIHTITVASFCSYYRLFLKEINSMKRLNKTYKS